jgi:DNA/RNA-binding domain of Phe-tRNA-synthetase-like protein
LQGKGVYKINNIVDINNLISLKSKFPVGSYNIKNLPVLTDSTSSFRSPTSDSERAMITKNVSEILMYIILLLFD